MTRVRFDMRTLIQLLNQLALAPIEKLEMLTTKTDLPRRITKGELQLVKSYIENRRRGEDELPPKKSPPKKNRKCRGWTTFYLSRDPERVTCCLQSGHTGPHMDTTGQEWDNPGQRTPNYEPDL